mmetsp:Transcript_3842/g.9919  ORF Transcript_3842/g.9919 Transcript_3842/m.9919 type:complete len:183 (-) Transcript_3842:223-771(-)
MMQQNTLMATRTSASSQALARPSQGRRMQQARAAAVPLCGCASVCRCAARRTGGRRVAPARAAVEAGAATSDLPETWASPPRGHKVYETMIIYNPDAQDSEREAEIQSFEDLLSDLGATDVAVSYENVPQRMAYPIDGYNVGIYVLFMYCAPSNAAKAIQQKLSAPSIEKEKSVLRFMTTRA